MKKYIFNYGNYLKVFLAIKEVQIYFNVNIFETLYSISDL